MEIAKWRKVVNKHFPELTTAAEIGLSVIFQLGIEDINKPFALIYLDASSSGKTTILNFFLSAIELTHYIDDLTHASFVSHAANRTQAQLQDIDLLPKIKDKVLIVRDMSSIFSKREEELAKFLGILTRVLDGEGYQSSSGVYGLRGYKGEYLFMMLGASTPVTSKVFRMMSRLGSRLLFFNIDMPYKNDENIIKSLFSAHSLQEKELICRKATLALLKSEFPKDKIKWGDFNKDKKLMQELLKVINIVSQLRSYKNEDGLIYKEHSYRMINLLLNFMKGHAVLCSRNHLSEEDLILAIRLALSSVPYVRLQLFRGLIQNKGRLKTPAVMTILKFSRKIAIREMRAFKCTDIATVKKIKNNEIGRSKFVLCLNKSHEWFLTERFKYLYPLTPHSCKKVD